MKNKVSKILLPIIVCMSVSLVLGEFAFRTFSVAANSASYWSFKYSSFLDPNKSFHRPHLDEIFYGQPFRTNSLGLRGPQIDASVEQRILWIGSSVALGWGVAQEDTLAQKIQNQTPNTLVINAGVGGHRAPQHFQSLLELEPIVHPQRVVWMFHLFDLTPESLKTPAWMRFSFLASTIDSLLPQASLIEVLDLSEKLKPILQAAQYCREKKLKFVILMVPDLRDPENFEKEQLQIAQLLINEKIRVRFIPRSVLPISSKELTLTPQDPHGNEKYQQFLAQDLSQQEGLFD